MSVLATLAREHRLFETLIARLRFCAERDGPGARARVSDLLQVLLPALERHDAVETLVFGEPGQAWERDERSAHELVEAQHDALRGLRAEVQTLLREKTDAPFSRLALLVDALCGKLEWHLKTEELLVWPLYLKRTGRSVAHSLEREAEKGVAALEASVARLNIDQHQKEGA
jgi:hypothetical protein